MVCSGIGQPFREEAGAKTRPQAGDCQVVLFDDF
jgi:hypothetical protein